MQYFQDDPVGTLVTLESDEMAGLRHHIWFPYARDYMGKVREGGLVAVRNFNTWGNEPRYSVLEVVEVMPVHYALGSSPGDAERAFPGFVTEAARSAKQDWEQETPTEESTQIRTTAIPTGIEIGFNSNQPELHRDESMPMQGETVHLLLPDLVQQIINKDMLDGQVPTIPAGSLVHTPDADVLVRTDELLSKHFGVFGFTGAGKSNLMSTLISRLLTEASEPPRIVLFDLMSEYIPLLIDLVDQLDNAYILALEPESLPGGESTRQYIWGEGDISPAAEAVTRTQLLPTDIADLRSELQECVERVLKAGKIRVYDPGEEALRANDLLEELLGLAKSARGGSGGAINRWLISELEDLGSGQVSDEKLLQLRDQSKKFRQRSEIPTFRGDESTGGTQAGLFDEGNSQGFSGETLDVTQTSADALYNITRRLNQLAQPPEDRPPQDASLNRGELLDILDGSEPGLLLIQSDNDDRIRDFSSDLINLLFHTRRRSGRNKPQTLFVYDEADEFIPGQTRADTSYAASRGAAATLARRGRKFGMGLTIATQRVAYLDTSILAQPHTYFVSKLPRQYDRDTMAEAFGITEDMMRHTLRFRTGDWLLVSFDATGLTNVPIPIHLPNANDRVRDHLD